MIVEPFSSLLDVAIGILREIEAVHLQFPSPAP